MAEKQSSASRVRVICEACALSLHADCQICGGARYYYWDPESGLCYTQSGGLISVNDEAGHNMPVVRRHDSKIFRSNTDVKGMLDAIEEWVAETPVRKWRLTLDENGWQACVWFNRFKKTCFETSNINLEACITRSYSEIMKRRSSRDS